MIYRKRCMRNMEGTRTGKIVLVFQDDRREVNFHDITRKDTLSASDTDSNIQVGRGEPMRREERVR